MLFNDAFQTEDFMADAVATNRFDSSFSLGDIMEQKSINALNTSTLNNNASANAITNAAEKSTNHLLVAALPKKTAAYVWRLHFCDLVWFVH